MLKFLEECHAYSDYMEQMRSGDLILPPFDQTIVHETNDLRMHVSKCHTVPVAVDMSIRMTRALEDHIFL
ncbi:uncharacterized protein N7458_000106 [Penicillium daleae]|uniref:Uncharacterized protein n=1 Tax=Penicillium daleae TaxID=63821 RepID=A0AAD6CFE5_9EURO|nr:uncharacterized protein N7458_000106 [Penicillium daleae]KAJ5464420.1 hypothetical protein N7458_000106 [Penicillium daleae]